MTGDIYQGILTLNLYFTLHVDHYSYFSVHSFHATPGLLNFHPLSRSVCEVSQRVCGKLLRAVNSMEDVISLFIMSLIFVVTGLCRLLCPWNPLFLGQFAVLSQMWPVIKLFRHCFFLLLFYIFPVDKIPLKYNNMYVYTM